MTLITFGGSDILRIVAGANDGLSDLDPALLFSGRFKGAHCEELTGYGPTIGSGTVAEAWNTLYFSRSYSGWPFVIALFNEQGTIYAPYARVTAYGVSNGNKIPTAHVFNFRVAPTYLQYMIQSDVSSTAKFWVFE